MMSQQISRNLAESTGDTAQIYASGEYLEKNPHWHVRDSPWKARDVARILARNNLQPKTVCDVGCGAGQVLALLQEQLQGDCRLWGYDISPQAMELCRGKENERLQFEHRDITRASDVHFDVILLLDVIEHVEDPIGFLRQIKPLSAFKILHIPLAMSAIRILAGNELIFGDLHYFTKDAALKMLTNAGYEVVDWFYTDVDVEAPVTGWKSRLIRLPRKLLFSGSRDLAVRALGGYRLMVLAK